MSDHPGFGWMLLSLGLGITGVGLVWILAPSIPWLGRLRGDIRIERENFRFALNSWIYPNVSEWQEYWAGETASPVGLPLKGTTHEHGPGAGLRYHALLIMEPYWVQQKVEMPRPRFTAQQLGDYIDRCKANGGAVTINLGIYQDGTVDPNAVDVLKEVRKRAR